MEHIGKFVTVLFRANLQNVSHFVGVAYPPNKISKTVLKMQAFYACFIKFCLALNSSTNSIHRLEKYKRIYPSSAVNLVPKHR